ncbi:hypothetical protein LZ31DRAFT_112513 [Colletotrichum somersetense]|nr:hypothetical protein LZ31DRAFT_112513 [Colletotrichum somersetense]
MQILSNSVVGFFYDCVRGHQSCIRDQGQVSKSSGLDVRIPYLLVCCTSNASVCRFHTRSPPSPFHAGARPCPAPREAPYPSDGFARRERRHRHHEHIVRRMTEMPRKGATDLSDGKRTDWPQEAGIGFTRLSRRRGYRGPMTPNLRSRHVVLCFPVSPGVDRLGLNSPSKKIYYREHSKSIHAVS